MPTPTYTPLANLTLSTTATSVTFSSIPATYRDLVVVIYAKTTDAGGINPAIRLNGDTGSNYSYIYMAGNGTSATSGSFGTSSSYVIREYTTVPGELAQIVVNIMDYSATNKHKSALIRSDNAAKMTNAYADRWANTAAVTSVQVFVSSNNFSSGSTFALYGIAA